MPANAAGSCDFVAQRRGDGAPSRPCGEEQGAVDVEEHQPRVARLRHQTSSRRTATSRSRSRPARLPGSHDSHQHAAARDGGVDQRVLRRREGDVGDAVDALAAEEEEIARPRGIAVHDRSASRPGAPRRAGASSAGGKGGLHQPRAVHAPWRHATPLVWRTRRTAPAPSAPRAAPAPPTLLSGAGVTSPSTSTTAPAIGQEHGGRCHGDSCPERQRAPVGRRSESRRRGSTHPPPGATDRRPRPRSRCSSPHAPSPRSRRGRPGSGATLRRARRSAPSRPARAGSPAPSAGWAGRTTGTIADRAMMRVRRAVGSARGRGRTARAAQACAQCDSLEGADEADEGAAVACRDNLRTHAPRGRRRGIP